MSRMFHGCTSLKTITVGNNFTFFGATTSRMPGSEFPYGVWRGTRQATTDAALSESVSKSASKYSSESSAYASDSIPSFVADTYTRVDDDSSVSTIVSLYGSGGDRYAVEAHIVDDGDDGTVLELTYDLSSYERDELSVGSTMQTAVNNRLSAKTVRAESLAGIRGNNSVKTVYIEPKVAKIKSGAFKHAPNIVNLEVNSSQLTTRSSVAGSLYGSKVKHVKVTAAKNANAVKRAFDKYAHKNLKN